MDLEVGAEGDHDSDTAVDGRRIASRGGTGHPEARMVSRSPVSLRLDKNHG